MEAPLVELRPERRFRLRTKAANGQLAELVGERLAGPANVAVNLGLHLVLRQRRVAGEVIDRLLSRPAVAVDAGVDHQPRRAPHLVAQLPELLVWRPVDAELVAEPFAVAAPALAHS